MNLKFWQKKTPDPVPVKKPAMIPLEVALLKSLNEEPDLWELRRMSKEGDLIHCRHRKHGTVIAVKYNEADGWVPAKWTVTCDVFTFDPCFSEQWTSVTLARLTAKEEQERAERRNKVTSDLETLFGLKVEAKATR